MTTGQFSFSNPFTELLKVIRETENDDLTGVMQKLISTYGDQHQVASIAVDIARDLVCIHCTMYKIDCYPNIIGDELLFNFGSKFQR